MATVTDNAGNEVEEYRFQTGSLYKFDADADAYVHVFRQVGCNTKTSAIAAYEEAEYNEEANGDDWIR